jgi:hypothetical protein
MAKHQPKGTSHHEKIRAAVVGVLSGATHAVVQWLLDHVK